MKSKAKPYDITMLCHSARPDDGLTPLELAKERRKHGPNKKPHHRDLQYAKAASQTLDLALNAACCGSPLEALQLHHVEVAPGGAVLHVTLVAPESAEADLVHLAPHLPALAAQLRMTLAGSIRRRRTPVVRLHLLPGRWPTPE